MVRKMTANPSLVSVIVPVRNGERYLAAALQSVLAQNYTPLEIIVVDGHSTDRTVEIARSFPSVRVLPQQERGVGDAYNLGLAAAQGAWIAFLEHDDLWTSDKLRVQLGYMQQHPQVLCSLTKARFFLEPGCTYPKSFKPEWLETPQSGCILSTFLARREVFGVVGTFNPALRNSGDVDWFARAKDRSVQVEFLPDVLLEKRVHDENVTHSQAQTSQREMLLALHASIRRQRPVSSAPSAHA